MRPLAFALLSACAPAIPTTNPPPPTRACNVATEVCTLPWPSSVFSVADTTSATGLRVELPPDADFGGIGARLNAEEADGFSPAGSIVTRIPGGGNGRGLPPSAEASVAPSSSIQLLIADATAPDWGTAWPISAQIDGELLVISPLRPLRPGSRFAVVITDGVEDGNGAPLARTAQMAEVLGSRRPDGELGTLWDYHRDLVALVHEGPGLDLDRVVQLWDFHTRSDGGITRDLQAMVETELAWIDLHEPALVWEGSAPASSHTRHDFHLTVPRWRPDRMAELQRDDAGGPIPAGEEEVQGYLLVPASATPEHPAIPLVFGHGMGVGADNMLPTLQSMDLDRGPFALAVIDWDLHGERGAGVQDVVALTGDLQMRAFADSLLQSTMDGLLLSSALLTVGEVPDRGAVVADGPLLYLGQSMGSFVGGLLVGVHPELQAAALNVGGAGMSEVLRRGTIIDVLGMGAAIRSHVEDAPAPGLSTDDATTLLMVMSQLALDPGDAIHLAGHWQADPLPSRRVDPPALLLQESLWDGIVPNATSETLARALGLPLAEPSPSVVPLLPTVTTPTCGAPASAMAQWYVSDDDFAAHLAMEDEGVQDQLLRWLASWGPGGLRGDIAFPDQGACP